MGLWGESYNPPSRTCSPCMQCFTLTQISPNTRQSCACGTEKEEGTDTGVRAVST